jgi:hypothetical protein
MLVETLIVRRHARRTTLQANRAASRPSMSRLALSIRPVLQAAQLTCSMSNGMSKGLTKKRETPRLIQRTTCSPGEVVSTVSLQGIAPRISRSLPCAVEASIAAALGGPILRAWESSARGEANAVAEIPSFASPSTARARLTSFSSKIQTAVSTRAPPARTEASNGIACRSLGVKRARRVENRRIARVGGERPVQRDARCASTRQPWLRW